MQKIGVFTRGFSRASPVDKQLNKFPQKDAEKSGIGGRVPLKLQRRRKEQVQQEHHQPLH